MGGDEYERQPAAEFLFQRRPLRRGKQIDPQPGEARLVVGNLPPCRVARHEAHVIRCNGAPTLTVTSDPYNSVTVVGGSGPDWSVFFSAEGHGQTEAEADERLRRCALTVTGSTLELTGPGLYEGHDTRSELLVEAPRDAGVVIHGCTPQWKFVT